GKRLTMPAAPLPKFPTTPPPSPFSGTKPPTNSAPKEHSQTKGYSPSATTALRIHNQAGRLPISEPAPTLKLRTAFRQANRRLPTRAHHCQNAFPTFEYSSPKPR